MPRRRDAFYIWAMPWAGRWPNKSEGPRPDQGIARDLSGCCRRGIATADGVNSGGKAEPDMAHDFEAKLLRG
jgi:hypothetical protein